MLSRQRAALTLSHDWKNRVCSTLLWEGEATALLLEEGVTVQIKVRLAPSAAPGQLIDLDALCDRLRFAMYNQSRQFSPIQGLAHEIGLFVHVEAGGFAARSARQSQRPERDERDGEEKEEEVTPAPRAQVRRERVEFEPGLWLKVAASGEQQTVAGRVALVSLAVAHHVAFRVVYDVIHSHGTSGITCRNGARYMLEWADPSLFSGHEPSRTKSLETVAEELFVALVLPGVHPFDVFKPYVPVSTPSENTARSAVRYTRAYHALDTLVPWHSPPLQCYTREQGRFVASLQYGSGGAAKPTNNSGQSVILKQGADDLPPLEYMDEFGQLFPIPPETFFEKARHEVVRGLKPVQQTADGEEEKEKEKVTLPTPETLPAPTASHLNKKQAAEARINADKRIPKLTSFFITNPKDKK